MGKSVEGTVEMKYLLFTNPTIGYFPSMINAKLQRLNDLKLHLENFAAKIEDAELKEFAEDQLEMVDLHRQGEIPVTAVHRAGVYQWHEAFNRGKDVGHVKHTLEIAPAELEQYDIIHINGAGGDAGLVDKVKEALKASSTLVIFNLDYAVETFQSGFPNLQDLYNACLKADFIFAVEPGQQALMNYLLHHVITPHRDKVSVPVIPHPCDVEGLKACFVPYEERVEKIIACFHRYDRHVYLPSAVLWNLEAYHPTLPSNIKKVPVFMANVGGPANMPFDLFDGYICGKNWIFYIYLLAHSTVGFEYYSIHCLSEDTEILTPEGWISSSQLGATRKVYGYEPSTQRLVVESIKKVWRHQATQLVHVQSEAVDLLMTPEHRILRFDIRNPNNYDVATAQDLLTPQVRAYQAIPTGGLVYNKGVNLSDDWLRLLGWLITEGSFKHPSGLYIYRAWSGRQPILSLLDRLGMDYSVYRGKFAGRPSYDAYMDRTYVTREDCARIYIKAESAKNIRQLIQRKRIPQYLLNMNQRQFNVFLNVMIAGDGSIHKGYKPGGTLHYITGDKVLADQLQHLCVINNHRCTIRRDVKGGYVLSIRPRAWWQVTYGYRATEVSKPQNVWCVTVPSGFIVVRRNGKVAVTGNSHSRFPEECAVLGIPVVGTTKSYSISRLHPYTAHGMLDFTGMRKSVLRLIEGDYPNEFYMHCADYAREKVEELGHKESKMRLLFEMDKWLQLEGKA
ncbi:MAG: hypothetical protein ACE5L6_02195 [Candidatus Bathyarchaeia archaeon]